MKEKIIYVADDGEEFATKDECIGYEMRTIDVEKIIKVTKTIHDICNMFDDCDECPFKREIGNTCRFNCGRFATAPGETWDFDDMK